MSGVPFVHMGGDRRLERDDLAIVAYDEVQDIGDGKPTRRRSTAVLEAAAAGWRWLYVHETWM